jgi:predicted esterase
VDGSAPNLNPVVLVSSVSEQYLMKTEIMMLSRSMITVLLFAVAGSAQTPVAFLTNAPVIDGVLDNNLRSLPARPLAAGIEEPDAVRAMSPTYRLAYGSQFLYLYIELRDAGPVFRDRAYQNGDGFQLVIAHQRSNGEPTNEFYVMGFATSPEVRPRRKQFIWYHDVDLRFDPLKKATMATRNQGSVTSIELLLPWSEVYPYHPWLSDAIGFNLCYVKALPENRVANACAAEDDRIQSEQSPRRYLPLVFQQPGLASGEDGYAILARNHQVQGKPVDTKVAVVSAIEKQVPFEVTIRSSDGVVVTTNRAELKGGTQVVSNTLAIPSAKLPPGEYEVVLRLGAATPEPVRLTVLPAYDVKQFTERLSHVEGRIAAGSYHTLQFQLQEIARLSDNLRPSDTAKELGDLAGEFAGALRNAEQGRDVIAGRTGIQRRAYLSAVDHTLQPYTVRIPPRMRKSAQYPLLVYLHGSGEDDRDQLSKWEFPDNFIQLAPRGRGTSNAYSADHAQYDIRESIDDVIANYPVDPSRIILVGFSMGGYGVYRTFYETPGRYRGLAIFSGHPDMARSYLGGDHPDFLEDQYLRPFAKMPVFVFHGGQDRNCPIELTRQLVYKLKAAGASVEFHLEEQKGHERAGEEILAAFREWLKQFTEPAPNPTVAPAQ